MILRYVRLSCVCDYVSVITLLPEIPSYIYCNSVREAGFHLVISGRAEMGQVTASLALRAMLTLTL